MIVKIKPKSLEDREKIIVGLVNSGYKTSVLEENNWPNGTTYFIVFEVEIVDRTESSFTPNKDKDIS